MYNRSQITEKFSGLIGIRPTKDVGNRKALIDKDLAISASGHYVNDMTQLFTVENFVNAAEMFAMYDVQEYDPASYYRKGEVVSDEDYCQYECLLDNTGEPLSSAQHWKPTTLLSVWFREKYNAAVFETIDALIEKKRAGGYGKLLKGDTELYNGEGVKQNSIKKSGRFVGYVIRLKSSDLNMNIQRMGMQLTGPATVPIYLYHSSQAGHLNMWNFVQSVGGRFNYGDVPPAVDLNIREGYYVIGYYEDDLPVNVEAIKLISNAFASGGCSGCGSSGSRPWSNYISVEPVSVATANKLDGMVWSLEDAVYDESTNWGLNFAMSFRCDMSDLFIRQRDSFVPALMARLRIKFLDALANNTRNNTMGDQVQGMARSAYVAEDESNPFYLFNKAIKALDFEFSGINNICLPVEIYGQITYGTV